MYMCKRVAIQHLVINNIGNRNKYEFMMIIIVKHYFPSNVYNCLVVLQQAVSTCILLCIYKFV